MKALDRKLVRDLWRGRGMAVAIAAVVAAGLSLYVGMLATFDSLAETRRAYYQRYQFADVFANVGRAPRELVPRIAELAGVAVVETRVVADVTLDVPGVLDPARGRLVSLPEHGLPLLNGLHLLAGRFPDPRRAEEVVASERFAAAQALAPGDHLFALINGRRQRLRIVGTALSPEFIYAIAPGDLFPDPGRYGVIWMGRKPLATAFEMEGGWNDVALHLLPDAVEGEVLRGLDHLLEPYGGRGAIPRRDQTSNWYLENELLQLTTMSRIVPTIFLLVAAFLVNVVLSRLVAIQREQIAQIKALGYSNFEVAWHFVKWSLVVSLLGGALGCVIGVLLTRGMLGMYQTYFAFPFLELTLRPAIVLSALGISVGAASVGAISAVRLVVALQPAEAMRPASPARYARNWSEALFGRVLALRQADRIILRNLVRRPLRTAMSTLAIAFAGAILVVGGFALDALDVMLETTFGRAQRQDLTVTLVEPRSEDVRFALAALPGVEQVEVSRSAPVRMRIGTRTELVAIVGLPRGAELQRVCAAELGVRELPSEGLVLSDALAKQLAVRAGDVVLVEIVEGRRARREVTVAGTVEEYIGTAAYMDQDALGRLLRERSFTGAALRVDRARLPVLLRELKATPAVAGVGSRQGALDSFDEFLAENLGTMTAIQILFACVIAFGVIYNSSRIALSERSRELASLRVLGFTRREVAYILLGELVALTAIALPLSMLIGYLLVYAATSAFETELYRFPFAVSSRSLARSLIVVSVATALSAWVVRRRLERLDLIGVLKTRE